MADQPKKESKSQGVLSERMKFVAMELFKAKSVDVNLRRRTISKRIEDSFSEAAMYVEMEEAYDSGQAIKKPMEQVVAPTVKVIEWNHQQGGPQNDEYGKPVVVERQADVYSYAPGKPADYPTNTAYIKGRLQLGMPIRKDLKEPAKRYFRELKSDGIEAKLVLV